MSLGEGKVTDYTWLQKALDTETNMVSIDCQIQ